MLIWAGVGALVRTAWTNPDGNRNVVYANGDSQNRNLNLNWDDNDWNANCRFLVRRKFLMCTKYILWLSEVA